MKSPVSLAIARKPPWIQGWNPTTKGFFPLSRIDILWIPHVCWLKQQKLPFNHYLWLFSIPRNHHVSPFLLLEIHWNPMFQVPCFGSRLPSRNPIRPARLGPDSWRESNPWLRMWRSSVVGFLGAQNFSPTKWDLKRQSMVFLDGIEARNPRNTTGNSMGIFLEPRWSCDLLIPVISWFT